MKNFITLGTLLISCSSVVGQWVEMGSNQISDFPTGLCQGMDGTIISAITSVHIPSEPGSALPYQTNIYRFSESGDILNQFTIGEFVAQSVFTWNDKEYLFGSGQTSTGIYSLELVEITDSFTPSTVLNINPPDTSCVARSAYIDSDNNLVLLCRRFYADQQDFYFIKLDFPGLIQVSSIQNAVEGTGDYNFFELPALPQKYCIVASDGTNYFLEKEDLNPLTYFSTQLEPMNLHYEKNPTVMSDSTYMICGDNFSIEGFGGSSAYVVVRNAEGDLQSWFEIFDSEWELTNRNCGYSYDPVSEELFIGITAVSEPFSQDVPDAQFGIARYDISGVQLGLDIHGDPGRFYSPKKMLRLSTGNFVMTGITSLSGIEEDENQLDVFFAWFDENGNMMNAGDLKENSRISVKWVGSNSFRVELGLIQSAVCEVYDLLGNLILVRTVVNGEQFEFDNRAEGIYLMRLVKNGITLSCDRVYSPR